MPHEQRKKYIYIYIYKMKKKKSFPLPNSPTNLPPFSQENPSKNQHQFLLL